jgi:hypothetical protein
VEAIGRADIYWLFNKSPKFLITRKTPNHSTLQLLAVGAVRAAGAAAPLQPTLIPGTDPNARLATCTSICIRDGQLAAHSLRMVDFQLPEFAGIGGNFLCSPVGARAQSLGWIRGLKSRRGSSMVNLLRETNVVSLHGV